VALALVLAACSAGGSGVPTTTAVPQATATVSAAAAAASTAAPSTACAPPTNLSADLGHLVRNGPSSGVWVGMNLDWGAETAADVTTRLGSPPATVVSFVSFPLTPDDVTNLQAAVSQARDAGAVLVVTLQPWGGLSSVTDQAIADVAQRLAAFGTEGVATIVRFAHEMNGTWYPWSQDPGAYVAAFRRVADAVHATAPTAAMLWAPNQGEGYPFTGGQYSAIPGGAAARALDTNGDGRLDSGDDPYAPYWPGAAYVDWVGMSLYHWGTTYPWGANTIPAAGKFAKMITGSPTVGGVAVPDFYASYAERYGKPLAIVETAALFRPGGGGAAASAIKTAWLTQVFSADTRSRFPLVRMVNWFDWRKFETEVNAVVDWRITADPALRASFLAAMTDGFHLGPVVPKTAPVGSCSSP
jgi:Glycosyl hydrolase family 26